MYTKEQIINLSALIGKAIKNYRDAITTNLRTLGTAIQIQGDDGEVNGININVEDDGTLYPWTVDRIRWNEEYSIIEVHASFINNKVSDEWICLSELGDAADYVLEAIQW